MLPQDLSCRGHRVGAQSPVHMAASRRGVYDKRVRVPSSICSILLQETLRPRTMLAYVSGRGAGPMKNQDHYATPIPGQTIVLVEGDERSALPRLRVTQDPPEAIRGRITLRPIRPPVRPGRL